MKASFVLVNYNRKDEVLLTIAKSKELIKNNLQDYEIVIIDNASTDGSADAIKSTYPDVVLIENKVNTGAPAWNLGFEKAKGDYFIVIDDDSHIESGLEEALVYLNKNKDVGVLALNVVSGPYTSKMWNLKDGQDVVGFIGCGAIIRRETYEKVGGYADWMFLYVNEWEYGLRVVNAGYKVRFFSNSIVQHRASAVNRTSKRFRVYVTKHELGIVYKHFSVNRWQYMFRVIINNLKPLKDGQFKHTWWNVLGMIDFFKMKKNLTYTPVSKDAQNFFATTYITTQNSAFGFLFNKKQTV